jgi:hypothetical protein
MRFLKVMSSKEAITTQYQNFQNKINGTTIDLSQFNKPKKKKSRKSTK